MKTTNNDLRMLANEIRKYALASIYGAGSGHPGGSLSEADLLAYICKVILEWDRPKSSRTNQDRFILSKGHACAALYAAAAELGMIDHRQLTEFRKLGSPLQGHTHVRTTPWVETSTGSLGQGFSVAVGMAIGLRHKGKSGRVYVMLGDGELQEGEVWEGVMCAGHYKLDKLCAIIDYNKMQSDDLNEKIMALEPLRAKWEAFNWHVVEIDGHNFDAITKVFPEAARTEGVPTVIIAHTVKGKGVSYMEGDPRWHGSVKMSEENLIEALRDLGVAEGELQDWLEGFKR